jgi:alpha-1,2-mannosyltransferase
MRLSERLRLRPLEFALVLVALALFVLFLAPTLRLGRPGDHGPADLRIFWTAAGAYLHGRSPYVAPAAVSHQGDLFVYPAAMAALFAPLGWLPFGAVTLLWTLVSGGAVLAALWLLGVRDIRCYSVVLVSYPLISSITVGTLTPFLLVATAALWRWRDRQLPAGFAAAFLLVSKLFLWPLVVWLLATRRYRAAALSVGVAVLATAAAWARIGFAGLTSYPELLHRLTLLEGPWSYQPVWLLPGSAEAKLVVLEVLACGGALMIFLARRLGDLVTFRLAVGIALAVSPILWAHYFALLIPLLDAGFSLAWLLLLAFWISRVQTPHGSVWRVAAFSLVAMLAVALASTRSELQPTIRPARVKT